MKTYFFSLALILFSGCSGIMYYPTQNIYFDPAEIDLHPESIYFKNFKNQTLHGWWFESKSKPSKGTLVFFHGNAENLTSHFMQLSWLPAEGYSYFIFDYPGYGQSEGAANTGNVVRSGYDAILWVHKNKDPRPLIIYGQSIGGITALKGALDVKKTIPLRLVIIDSSFSSYQKIARYKMSLSWITWLLQPLTYILISDEYAPQNLQDLSPTPVLLIHGQSDQIVEPRWSDEIFVQLKDPKEIWKIPRANHTQTFWIDNMSYRKKLVDYLDKHR